MCTSCFLLKKTRSSKSRRKRLSKIRSKRIVRNVPFLTQPSNFRASFRSTVPKGALEPLTFLSLLVASAAQRGHSRAHRSLIIIRKRAFTPLHCRHISTNRRRGSNERVKSWAPHSILGATRHRRSIIKATCRWKRVQWRRARRGGHLEDIRPSGVAQMPQRQRADLPGRHRHSNEAPSTVQASQLPPSLNCKCMLLDENTASMDESIPPLTPFLFRLWLNSLTTENLKNVVASQLQLSRVIGPVLVHLGSQKAELSGSSSNGFGIRRWNVELLWALVTAFRLPD